MTATLALALAAVAAQGGRFQVPEGFAVEQAAAAARSFSALAFDGRGELYAADEAGPVLWLVDADGDGFHEGAEVVTDAVHACQGLAWRDGVLYATGLGPPADGEGEDGPGLFRIEVERRTDRGVASVRATAVRRLLSFTHFGEHGAHGIAVGPDGCLFVMAGDHTGIVEPGAADDPLAVGYEGAILPVIEDPGGFGHGCRYPHGFVARVDPDSGAWRYHSVGYRNAYDLAFRGDGELFTVDSDMEWDVGLPWYRPVRALHAIPTGDYGRRRSSGCWPDGVLDALPPLAELGRGSPTGVVVYEHRRFPAAYRGALIVGDWSRGRILALRLEPDGATFALDPFHESEGVPTQDGAAVLVEGQPLNVTDLEVAPDGSLVFCTGGRGAVGAVYRLTHGDPVVQDGDGIEGALAQPQLASAWARGRLAALRVAAGEAWRVTLEGAIGDPALATEARVQALRVARWCGVLVSPEVLHEASADLPTAAIVPAAAQQAEHLLAGMLLRGGADAPLGQRRVLEAGWELDASWNLSLAPEYQLSSTDRWIRWAARRGAVVQWRDTLEPISTWIAREDARLTIEDLLLRTRGETDDADALFAWTLRWLQGDRWRDAKLSAGEHRDLLRVLEVQVDRLGEPRERVRRKFEALLLEALPPGDPVAYRSAVNLLARFAPDGVHEALQAAMDDATLPREERIHAAYGLRAVETGWTPERFERALDWFEEACGWSGGASFGGYLEAMMAQVVARMSDDDVRAVRALRGGLGPRTAAQLLARGESALDAELVADLERAWAALDEDDPLLGGPVKDDVLRVLAAEPRPALVAWLRRVHDDEPRRRDAVLPALARLAEEADRARFEKGLARGAHGVPEACARALVELGGAPEDPGPYRAALDAAPRLDVNRARALVELLAAWTGVAADLDGWDAAARAEALAAQEAWFAERFPEHRPEPSGVPEWSADFVLAFLEGTADRPGSAARGARAFQRAGCSACHLLGEWGADAGVGLGPDLTTVGSRLGLAELFEAVAYPSRHVSDQYRAHVATTFDGDLHEGRLVGESSAGVELLLADGRRLDLARDELAALEPSRSSLMPEGQLAALTLEETKDLFAFLVSEGRVDPDELRAPDWVRVLDLDRQASLWEGTGPPWRLHDGVLVGRTKGLEQNRYLLSAAEYGDFEVEFDVRLAKGTNSGFQYRSTLPGEPDGTGGQVDPVGYQADLGLTNWGAVYATDGRGFLAQPRNRPRRRAVDEEGWNHVYVRVEGARHYVEINGAPLAELEDDAHAAGRLGFQLHAGEAMEARFANLRIRGF